VFERDTNGATRIVRGVLIGVNTTARVCDVRVADSNGAILRDVPWSSSTLSPSGDGVDFCPAVGYVCWVLLSDSNLRDSSDVSQVVLSFMPPLVQGSYGVDREPLSEGDVKIGTGAGARIFLDGGTGDLQLEGGPGASTTFFSAARLTETITGDARCVTDGGEFNWKSGSGETTLTLDVKRAPTDDAGYARVSVGAEGGVGRVDVSVLRDAAIGSGDFVAGTSDLIGVPGAGMYISGTQDGDVVLHGGATLALSGNAEASLRAGYSVTISADGVDVSSKSGDARVSVRGDTVEVSGTRVRILAGDLSVIDMNRGGLLLHTGTEESAEQNKQLVTEDILPWMFNHVHPTPSGMSLAPAGGPSDTEAAQMPDIVSAFGALRAALDLVAAQFALCTPTDPGTFTSALAALTTAINLLPSSPPPPPASIISVTSREDVLTQDTKVR